MCGPGLDIIWKYYVCFDLARMCFHQALALLMLGKDYKACDALKQAYKFDPKKEYIVLLHAQYRKMWEIERQRKAKKPVHNSILEAENQAKEARDPESSADSELA